MCTAAADGVSPIRRYHSDADELLEAVVAAGFGRVEGAVGVHPGAMDAASNELPRRLALFPPAPDLGPVALPDLNARAARDVEGAVSVEGDPVGVADVLLQADKRTVSGEDLPAMVFAVHHIDEIICGDQQLVWHVELTGVGAGSAGHGPEVETLWNEDGVTTAEGEEVLAPGREAVDPVLAVPVRDEDIAVGRLDRVGRHVERLALGTRLALGADRQQHLAGRCVFGNGVEAS